MQKKLIFLAAILVLILLSGCIQPPQPPEKCGDSNCSASENWKSCPADCPQPLFCGDKTCSETENWKNCEADCEKPAVPFCGDKVCDTKEQANTKLCPKDCPTTSKCGDGICDAKENANPALCPQDCLSIQTHTECQNQLCTTVDGAGTNQCTSDSDCAQPTHKECQNQQCVAVEGVGTDQCTNNSDCAQPTHKECQNQQCVSIEGAGTDQCSANSDCIAQTHTVCQNQQCVSVAGTGTNQCTANAECASVTESHFGVHLGSLNYNSAVSHIRELGGQIYARNVVYGDAFGWKAVKGSQESIALCRSCCDSTKSACGCRAGDKYYCKPSSRDSLLNYPILIDFYNNNLNQLVNFEASRYDDTTPKELTADYPHGHEDIYGDYVSFLAQNFGNKVKYWVVGNEVEALVFWVGTPEEYADMVAIASKEIRENCADCKVGISFAHPNLSPKHPEQIELWYSAIGSVCNSFDFIDVHFYDSRFIEQGQLDKWKQTCPGKEFVTSETGVLDYIVAGGKQQAGGSLEKQAQDLAKYDTLLFAEGYNKIYMYLMDTDYGMGDIFLHNGLIDETTNTRKPAFYSYKTMIEKVDYFTSITKLSEGQYKYTFSDKEPVYVLWCDSGTCIIPTEITGSVKVTDYLGNETTKDASQIILTESPIFVEEIQ